MKKISFNEALVRIIKEDNRYHPEAYFFLREALAFTAKTLKKPEHGPRRHISAAELLEGIRQYALREYGPMAKTVLSFWGIKECADFGRIVFNLVNKRILRKAAGDSVHDFDRGYDFEAAFRRPYQRQNAEGRMKNGETQPSRRNPPRSAAADRPSAGGELKK